MWCQEVEPARPGLFLAKTWAAFRRMFGNILVLKDASSVKSEGQESGKMISIFEILKEYIYNLELLMDISFSPLKRMRMGNRLSGTR